MRKLRVPILSTQKKLTRLQLAMRTITHSMTDNLHQQIDGTSHTPKILFTPGINTWEISGRSYPEEAYVFYEPILLWLKSIRLSEVKSCAFVFKYEYFNTATMKVLMDILTKLRNLQIDKSVEVSIKWFYEEEDEDMRESGESLMEIIKIPIELISV